MTVTRLQVLEHARELAEQIGAVENGVNFFEAQNGKRHSVAPFKITNGVVTVDELCGVCISGAVFLAQMTLGVEPDDVFDSLVDIQPTAEIVSNYSEGAMTTEITKRGLPYVLAVLDRMIDDERARQPVAELVA